MSPVNALGRIATEPDPLADPRKLIWRWVLHAMVDFGASEDEAAALADVVAIEYDRSPSMRVIARRAELGAAIEALPGDFPAELRYFPPPSQIAWTAEVGAIDGEGKTLPAAVADLLSQAEAAK